MRATIAALLLVLAVGAKAEDWKGFYMGVSGGQAKTVTTWNDYERNFWSASLRTQDSGAVYGLHAGYNCQKGAGVLGLEADYRKGGLSSRQTFSGPDYVESELDALASLRLRGGVAVEKALLYLTLGVGRAYGDHTFGNLPDVQTLQNKKLGVVYGAGLEHRLSARFSVRGEYLAARFPQTLLDTTSDDEIRIGSRAQFFSLALNWHL